MARRAALIALPLLILLTLSVGWALGLTRLAAVAEPHESVDAAYEQLDRLLGQHVRDGRVDYTGLQTDRDALERIAATFAERGPSQTPAEFPDEPAQFAYYINAYNVLTLHAVLRHLPLASVQDVHGVLEPQAGFGFFWAVFQKLDGRWTNLHDLENGLLRPRFNDARLHAAINCASTSCPTLAGRIYRAETLETQLNEAAAHFASDTVHVEVDHVAKQVRLSAIYGWYAEDFEADARRRELGPEVLDWIAAHADATVRRDVRHARRAKYPIQYRPYDWSLNAR